jgi:hypothetical protein
VGGEERKGGTGGERGGICREEGAKGGLCVFVTRHATGGCESSRGKAVGDGREREARIAVSVRRWADGRRGDRVIKG